VAVPKNLQTPVAHTHRPPPPPPPPPPRARALATPTVCARRSHTRRAGLPELSGPVLEFTHFAATSEDINNLSHGLMLTQALHKHVSCKRPRQLPAERACLARRPPPPPPCPRPLPAWA
jgi:hypothetical protein